MILIEGPDGVGKTTLAKKLQREMRSAYVHYGPMPKWWTAERYVEDAMRHAVFDRYHWSAWAYREVHEQPWDATVAACRSIDGQLRLKFHHNYTAILIYAKSSSWFDSLPEDDMFNRDQIASVNYRFRSVRDYFDVAWDVTSGWPDTADMLRRVNLSGWA